MIVRIATEGQYELDDGDAAPLRELEDRAVERCDSGDEAAFRDAFAELLSFVHSHGTELPEDELVGSDLILPPPDVSFEEAKAGFSGEGLIPD